MLQIDFLNAAEKGKELEDKIPVVYDITIDGVFLSEIGYEGSDHLQSPDTSRLESVLEWFIYMQLDDFIETEGHPDYDSLIKYFELKEEYEICADLLKRKRSCAQILADA